MMTSRKKKLLAEFAAADAAFKENKTFEISEATRMQLYGLSKQAKEGDCEMPMPPSSNVVLRSKWDAWTSLCGMSSEAAMREFLILYNSKATKKPDAFLERPSLYGEGVIRKKGALYKQRDLFKNWKIRNFVLQGSTLYYFLEMDNPVPRGSMDVSGCTVTVSAPNTVGTATYYPFAITHPSMSTAYNLSSDSLAEMNEWVAAIREAAASGTAADSNSRSSDPASSSSPATAGGGKSLQQQQQRDSAETSAGSAASVPPPIVARSPSKEEVSKVSKKNSMDTVELSEAVRGLSQEQITKIDMTVDAVLKAVSPDAEGWSVLFEKEGMVAKKRKSGDVCVRGDILLPFSVLEVFALLFSNDAATAQRVDPMKQVVDVFKFHNSHTKYQFIKFKQVWPTAARDMCMLSHWRLLHNGTVVGVSFSDPEAERLRPTDEGVVRADLVLGAYILRPTPKGTDFCYIAQSDLKGSIPRSVVSIISNQQPMICLSVKKILTENRSNKGPPYPIAGASASVQELRASVNASAGDASGGGATTTTAVGADTSPAGVRKSSSNSDVSSAASSSGTASRARKESNGRRGSGSGGRGGGSEGNAGGEGTEGDKEKLAAAYAKLSKKRDQQSKGHRITPQSLMILFLPFLLGYVMESPYRLISMVVGFVVAGRYLVRSHLGDPVYRKHKSSEYGQIPSGRYLMSFPVDLGKLLRFLDLKREETAVEVTITHVTVKACATVLVEMPQLNGHVIFGDFYRARNPADYDVSTSVTIGDNDSIMLKVPGADTKPIEKIATEVQSKTSEIRKARYTDKFSTKSHLLAFLPSKARSTVLQLLSYFGSYCGIDIPVLGITGFPLGVCTVISSPNLHGEDDVEVCVIPNNLSCSAPLTVTIGGIRILPALDVERKVSGTPVLNFSVSVNSHAATLADTRRFCSRLQTLLSNPVLMDAKLEKKKN